MNHTVWQLAQLLGLVGFFGGFGAYLALEAAGVRVRRYLDDQPPSTPIGGLGSAPDPDPPTVLHDVVVSDYPNPSI